MTISKYEICLEEIKGIRIGQAENAAAGTGCTVFIADQGMAAGLDVRGGGPASRESELLNPLAAAQVIHGIVLAGGSAFGLNAADGVMQYLEERGIGFDVGLPTKVPLVCQSDLFDLTAGDSSVRPDEAMGYAACVNSENGGNYRDGNHGAGCGATVGKFAGMDHCMKSGIGSYAVQIGELQVGAVVAVNALGDMMIASRHGDFPVKAGDKIAGMRVIPLIIEAEKMERAKEAAGGGPIFRILPYRKKRVGIVTTGSEVAKGRIKDAFGPAVRQKLAEYPAQVLGQTLVDDQKEHICQAIRDFLGQGADLILCTGGMSVDPDDRTPGAIMDTGARIVTYGAPVLPGAMLLAAYYENDGKNVPILGLPGCVMYAKRTVFDLVLPRIMADDPIKAEELAALGEGGLCLDCPVCTFPNCGFGKGR